MIEPRIKYYPVDNGDMSLLTLSDGTKILIDVSITEDSLDDNNDEKYNVKKDLLDTELKTKDEHPFIDVFILSHPDQDHIRGFEKHFFQGALSNYSKEDKKDKKIQIYEIWYSPHVFECFNKDLSEDAVVFKKEVKRRMDLYKTNQAIANQDGNRIRIIGYSDKDKFQELKGKISVPGTIVNEFNGKVKDDFEFFVHAPLKEDIEGEERNESSVVLQARFTVDGVEKAALAFFGGDAGWGVWEKILKKSKDEDLKWDLFLAPHHCSWTFFNDNTDEGKKQIQKSAEKILKYKTKNAKVISSCKEIKRNDDNPPSYKAMNEYIKVVGEKNFLCTATDSRTKPPEPLEFEIKSIGAQKINQASSKNILRSTLIGETIGSPKTYGE